MGVVSLQGMDEVGDQSPGGKVSAFCETLEDGDIVIVSLETFQHVIQEDVVEGSDALPNFMRTQ
jgi:hypothetical protein